MRTATLVLAMIAGFLFWAVVFGAIGRGLKRLEDLTFALEDRIRRWFRNRR